MIFSIPQNSAKKEIANIVVAFAFLYSMEFCKKAMAVLCHRLKLFISFLKLSISV
jgi:hypothetical protein